MGCPCISANKAKTVPKEEEKKLVSHIVKSNENENVNLDNLVEV